MPEPFGKKLQPDHPIGAFGLAAAVVRLLGLWFPSRCLPDRLLSARANLHIVRGPAHATVTRQGGKTHEGRLARHAAAEPLHGDQKHVFIDRQFSSRTKLSMERADLMASNRFNAVLVAAQDYMGRKRTSLKEMNIFSFPAEQTTTRRCWWMAVLINRVIG